MFKLVLILLGVLINGVLSANILFVSPLASPSHHIWNKVLTGGLLKNGHNVTMLTHEVEKDLPPNFSIITMEGFYKYLYDNYDMNSFGDKGYFDLVAEMYGFLIFTCDYDLKSAGYQALWDYPKDFKFDLIIYDASIGGRCYYPLMERFGNPPTMAVSPFLLPPILQTAFGAHMYSSYQPFYTTEYSNKMTLTQRLLNFVFVYFEGAYKRFITNPREEALVVKKFPDLKKSVGELEHDMDLLLCNIDPVLDYPIPLPPNIIPVGGLHARPSKPLPKDLKKILDEATQGVVLFSLGTNIRSSELGNQTIHNLLEAFAKLPQVVLWKFEAETLENIPRNVVVRKWLPQNDILGHLSIKLFVNHGGALSTQEAMYHGVPVVGIPFFGDQTSNIRKMEERGIAKRLDRTQLTVDNVHNTLNEVISSPEFRKNMGDISRRYRDQPMSALDRAVFWIEYVLKHKRVQHLVSPARDMPLYQTSNLEVVVAFIASVVLSYYILTLVARSAKSVFIKPNHRVKEKLS